jgi:hypothetical protein
MMKPVVESELVIVHENVVQMKGKYEFQCRVVDRLTLDGIEVKKTAYHFSCREVHNTGIVKCVNCVVGALDAYSGEENVK